MVTRPQWCLCNLHHNTVSWRNNRCHSMLLWLKAEVARCKVILEDEVFVQWSDGALSLRAVHLKSKNKSADRAAFVLRESRNNTTVFVFFFLWSPLALFAPTTWSELGAGARAVLGYEWANMICVQASPWNHSQCCCAQGKTVWPDI